MLPLLYHHFTAYCTCNALISPNVTLTAPPFYWILHLQCTNFTRYCTCSRLILPDVAIAAPQFYWILHLQVHQFYLGLPMTYDVHTCQYRIWYANFAI